MTCTQLTPFLEKTHLREAIEKNSHEAMEKSSTPLTLRGVEDFFSHYFHPGIAAVIVGKTHPKRFGMGLSFNGRQSLANIRILSPDDQITLDLSL